MPGKSSRRWLREHFSDPYVKKAQEEKWRSRAVFKLKEIHERDKLFKPGMTVIDLGAAPGSWSQFVVSVIGKKGHLWALDILPMDPIPGVQFIQGDFTQDEAVSNLIDQVVDNSVDWVISDIAPNLSGIDSVDQPRSIALAELVLDFAVRILNKEGGLVIKVFQGEGFDAFLVQIRHYFTKVVIRKPKASRGRSREVYILAKMRRL